MSETRSRFAAPPFPPPLPTPVLATLARLGSSSPALCSTAAGTETWRATLPSTTTGTRRTVQCQSQQASKQWPSTSASTRGDEKAKGNEVQTTRTGASYLVMAYTAKARHHPTHTVASSSRSPSRFRRVTSSSFTQSLTHFTLSSLSSFTPNSQQ